MVDQRIIADWLHRAAEDFGFASSCLADEVEYFGHICFHFQQAAEKYLKTFIIAQELPFRKIHNLLVLLDSCCTNAPVLEALRPPCQLLNRFYVDTRYPVHWPTHFTKADAEEARSAVEKIREAIQGILTVVAGERDR